MDIQSNRANYLSTLQDLGFLPYPPAPIPESLNRNNDNESLLRALIAGAFMPQISRVELPDKKYMQLASGAVSVDPEARTIKFFGEKVGRVFLHPSSTLFDSQTFSEDMVFLSYAQLSSSGKQVQAQGQGNYGPKTFLVDVTRTFPSTTPSTQLLPAILLLTHLSCGSPASSPFWTERQG